MLYSPRIHELLLINLFLNDGTNLFLVYKTILLYSSDLLLKFTKIASLFDETFK